MTGGGPNRPARQQTLRDAIGWSYDLLSTDEQRLYRRLSVFAGGWSIAAAEDVAGRPETGELGLDALDGIGRLVDHSLARRIEGAGGDDDPRFTMLSTIREFGLERLATSGEADEARRRHGERFLRLAEEAAIGLVGPEQGRWLDRLGTEHDNLRAALGWAIESNTTAAVQLGAALWRF